MECVERLQHILIEIHNSIHVPELARWNTFRDQIMTTTQESVFKLGELVIEHSKLSVATRRVRARATEIKT
jgi:hypothetical protein